MSHLWRPTCKIRISVCLTRPRNLYSLLNCSSAGLSTSGSNHCVAVPRLRIRHSRWGTHYHPQTGFTIPEKGPLPQGVNGEGQRLSNRELCDLLGRIWSIQPRQVNDEQAAARHVDAVRQPLTRLMILRRTKVLARTPRDLNSSRDIRCLPPEQLGESRNMRETFGVDSSVYEPSSSHLRGLRWSTAKVNILLVMNSCPCTLITCALDRGLQDNRGSGLTLRSIAE